MGAAGAADGRAPGLGTMYILRAIGASDALGLVGAASGIEGGGPPNRAPGAMRPRIDVEAIADPKNPDGELEGWDALDCWRREVADYGTLG